MRLHVLGLPYSQVTRDYSTCAFTSKTREFVKMMAPHHEVYLYSSGACDVRDGLAEHVQVGDVRSWFPDGFDPVLTPISWSNDAVYWREFNRDCARELDQRVEPRDLVLSAVSTNNEAFESVEDRAQLVEWQIGYEGVGWASHWIFESYAWMHHVYGAKGINDGRAYDDVVPGFRDPADFKQHLDGGYLLYLGRMTQRKGVAVAGTIAERLDMPIKFAGPGAEQEREGLIRCSDGTICHGEYVGVVGPDQRATLLGAASALIVPTFYVEPFGGVQIEAMMSGVPVVASDWGVFTETINPELRFRTLAEGCKAVRKALSGDFPVGNVLRTQAIARWSPEAVRPAYERALGRLDDLWGQGWYS